MKAELTRDHKKNEGVFHMLIRNDFLSYKFLRNAKQYMFIGYYTIFSKGLRRNTCINLLIAQSISGRSHKKL